MADALPTSTSDWIAVLDDETAHLENLARAAVAARRVSLRDAEPAFRELLDEQVRACRALEKSRARRRRALEALGRGPADLTEVVTGTSDPDLARAANSALDRWFQAARTTQRENDLNREFYGVALAAVEEAVSILTGSKTQSYDTRGRGVPGEGRATVTTSI